MSRRTRWEWLRTLQHLVSEAPALDLGNILPSQMHKAAQQGTDRRAVSG
jgi:hypothetical protein